MNLASTIAGRVARVRSSSLVVACVLFFAVGCSATVDPRQTKRADTFARETIELVRTGGLHSIRPRLEPVTAREPNLEEKVAQMRAVLPATAPDSVRLVSGEATSEGSVTKTKFVYRVFSTAGRSRVDIWIVDRGGRETVETLRIVEEP